MSDIVINPESNHGFHVIRYDYIHKTERTLCNVDRVEGGVVHTYCVNAWGRWIRESCVQSEFERKYERYEGGK